MLPVWLPDALTPDLRRAVHYTLLWGLEGVVLRSLGGARVPDVNEALLGRLAEAELSVEAVDPGLFEGPVTVRPVWQNDLARLAETLGFCRRVGCRRVIVGALPGGPPEAAAEPLREAATRAAAQGVVLAVRHEGEGRARAADLASVLEAAAHPALGACWDPTAALAEGEPPADGLARLGGHVRVVMVRPPLDSGRLDWPETLAALHRGGFDGPLCLDPAGLRPKEGLREATALIGMIREAKREA